MSAVGLLAYPAAADASGAASVSHGDDDDGATADFDGGGGRQSAAAAEGAAASRDAIRRGWAAVAGASLAPSRCSCALRSQSPSTGHLLPTPTISFLKVGVWWQLDGDTAVNYIMHGIKPEY